MKHSKKKSLKQATRPVEAPASLNVTQAAVHKERWREKITQKKLCLCMSPVSPVFHPVLTVSKLASKMYPEWEHPFYNITLVVQTPE